MPLRSVVDTAVGRCDLPPPERWGVCDHQVGVAPGPPTRADTGRGAWTRMEGMGESLRAIYLADQRDRTQLAQAGRENDEERRRRAQAVAVADHARLDQVRKLAAAGEIHHADDHFYAAMIFQHGDELEDFRTAHELARVAAEMGHERARWLAAAAYDRWLMHQGKAQRYGTQFIAMGGGALHLWEVEETTTDEDRAEWGVPPLADALERVEGRIQAADVRFSPLPPSGWG